MSRRDKILGRILLPSLAGRADVLGEVPALVDARWVGRTVWPSACSPVHVFNPTACSYALLLGLMVVPFSSIGASDALVPHLDFTHFLGNPNDAALPVAVATDAEGNIYVAGITSGPGLPTVNALQPEYSPGTCGFQLPCPDVFVGKLRSDGSGFSYLTYLGGPLADSVSALAVDRVGNAYLTGVSSSPEFPIQVDLEPDNPAAERPYVLKLSPDGSRVVYATRLPGRNAGPLGEAPAPWALAVDSTGAAHVTGIIYGRGLQEVNGLGLDPGEMDVFRSDDRGRTWVPDSRGLFAVIGSFEFTAAASSPQGGTILYAASPYDLFRKQDADALWQRLETGGIDASNEIVGLAIDPSAPNRLYVASRSGLLLTTDGGQTWQDLSSNLLPAATQLYSIALAPTRPATLYAGGHGNAFRSDDGGLTWSQSGLNQTAQGIGGIAGLDVDPTDPETVYATVYRSFEFRDALFKTVDGGATWRELYDGERPGARYPLAIDPITPSTLYVGTFEGLVRSLDGGLSWADRSEGLPPGAIDYVEVDPSNTQRLYAGGRSGLFQSNNGGANWEPASTLLPTEMSSLVIDPANPNRLYTFGMPHPANAYVLKLSPDGSRLEYATLLGGNSDDYGFDIAVDETGHAWVTGYTGSLDFPATQGSFVPSSPGGQDGFVVQLSPDGSRLDYSAYLGGRRGIAVAPTSDRTVLLAGWAPNAAGDEDAVLWSLDTRTSEFAEEARLGGAGEDYFDRIAVASDGRRCLRGWTSSEGLFPDGPAQFSTGVFATCLSSEGLAEWGSFLGGVTGGLVHDPSGRTVLTASGVPGVAPFQGQSLAGIGTPFLTRFRLSRPEQQPRLDAVLNAGHFTPGLPAPGLIVSLFGDELGPPEGIVAQPSGGRFPIELGGVQVLVDGQPAPLLFVQKRQINTVLPFGVETRSQMRVEVAGSQQNTAAFYLTVAPSAPAIFALNGSGFGRAAVLNEDNTLNSSGNPAPRGSIVQIFATGSGPMLPQPQDGFIQPLDPPFPAVTLPIRVKIDHVDAEVLYAGAAPGLIAGVLQVNARVPSNIAVGANARLALIVGDRGDVQLPPTWVAVQ